MSRKQLWTVVAIHLDGRLEVKFSGVGKRWGNAVVKSYNETMERFSGKWRAELRQHDPLLPNCCQ